MGNSFCQLEILDLLKLRRCQVPSLVIVRLYREKFRVVLCLEPFLDLLNDHLDRVILVDLSFITSKSFRRVLINLIETRPRHIATQVECLEARRSPETVAQVENGRVVKLCVREVQFYQIRVVLDELLEALHDFFVRRRKLSIEAGVLLISGC